MNFDERSFYESIISAGAILSGFCGTFLSFRITREASYYRQAVCDFDLEKARDVFVGLTHFSSPLFLLILGTLCSVSFGFVIPLFALAGVSGLLIHPNLVVAGLVGALVLIAAYFIDELVHYRVISTRLLDDAREWRAELPIVLGGILIALILALATFASIANPPSTQGGALSIPNR
jgi:hypothetical protein